MAYAFNDDKSKVKVYVKDDFIVLDIDFIGMDDGETKSMSKFLDFLSPLTVDDVVVISASVKWITGTTKWNYYGNAYDENDESFVPRIMLEEGANDELVLTAMIQNFQGYTASSPILRVVLMNISDADIQHLIIG